MALPEFQSLMLPAFEALADGQETQLSVIRKRVADALQLTQEALQERTPGAAQSWFTVRTRWAVTRLVRAGLVRHARRGMYQLTHQGKRLLSTGSAGIDLKLFQNSVGGDAVLDPNAMTSQQKVEPQDAPEEALDQAVRQLRTVLEKDVLQRLQDAPPEFLERAVVDLLIAMGYGGGDAERGSVTGRSGDGGIDGTIKEDPLGLDEVYIQAKKYAVGNTVGVDALRNFVGALDAAGTNKGVFVTTASFTSAATNFLERSSKRVILIDGAELTRLMVDYDIGVRLRQSYRIKRIDEDYFDPET